MRIMMAALIAAALASPALAADDAFVRKQSPHAVGETLDRLTAIVKKKGATVFGRIDHAAGASKIGSDLRPTQVLLFGNPKLGTPVMQSAQETGLDLPMHVLAYEAADGKVWVVYRTAAAIGQARGMSADAPELMRIAKALDGLTNAAIAE